MSTSRAPSQGVTRPLLTQVLASPYLSLPLPLHPSKQQPSLPSASPLKKRNGLSVPLSRPSEHFSTSLSHSNSSFATSSDPASDSLGATPSCSRAEGDKKTPKEEKLKAPEHEYKPYVEGMRALRNLRRALAEE